MKIEIKYEHWIPRTLGVDAIVLYPFVLYAFPENGIDPRTIRHETMHVHQIHTVGLIRFYLSYLLYYLAGRASGLDHYTAYVRIPWEEDARGAE